MSNFSCRIPIKGIDDVLSAKFGTKTIGENKVPVLTIRQVANLREIYDRDKGAREWTGSNEDYNELIEYQRTLRENDAIKALNLDSIIQKFKTFTNVAQAFITLRKKFSITERSKITEDLASLFQDLISVRAKKYNVSRKEVVEGFISPDGYYRCGAAELFQALTREIEEVRLKLSAAKNNPKLTQAQRENVIKRIQLYNNIITNKEAFYTFVIKQLKSREGYIIKNDLSYAIEEQTSTIDDPISSTFDPESSTKESWHEVKDQRDMYTMTSAEIKHILSRIPISGERSIFGRERYQDPSTVYKTLKRVFRGMTSRENMMKRLENFANKNTEFKIVYDILVNDTELATQFYTHYKSDYQRYSSRYIDAVGQVVLKVINYKTKSKMYDDWYYNISTKRGTHGIFTHDEENNITINKDVLLEILSKVEKIIQGNSGILDQLKNGIEVKTLTEKDAIEALNQISIALSLNAIPEDTYLSPEAIEKIRKVLSDFISYGRAAISKSSNIRTFTNYKSGKAGKETTMREILSNIISVNNEYTEVEKEDDRVRYNGNTYFCDVASSYMGRLFSKFKEVFSEGKSTSNFLEEQFKSNPFMYNEERGYLNRWLRDAVENKSSFLHDTVFSRFLGEEGIPFEDFGENKHLSSILDMFFLYSEKTGMAGYPTFILGDSNVTKIIEAPIYSIEEIAEEMYNVYLQEGILQAQIKAIKDSILRKGQDLGSLKDLDAKKFGMLVFLNSVEEVKNGEVLTKDDFIRILKSRMEQEVSDFEKLLEAESISINHYFKNGVSEEEKKAKIHSFYWNYKFSQIMQMQLFTISPIFYQNGNSVDLQKRFKEIHASGKTLDTSIMEHQYQRTLLFQEVKFNEEDLEICHKLFVDALRNAFKGRDDYEEIMEAYFKTKVTDGQSYRTLKSYRDVMRGSGQWNSSAERAYNRINEIRAQIRSTGKFTEEQSKELNQLAVVFQPIKPFLYTKESIATSTNGRSSIAQIPVQYKCAEVVIIPELLPKGSKLADLISYAEEMDIDVVCADSGIKVGSFGAIDIKSATNVKEIREAAAKGEIHEWSYEDYVIQNNVPEHVRESRLFGTQTRKIVMANMLDKDPVTGETLSYSSYLGLQDTDKGISTFRLGGKEAQANAYNISRLYVSAIASNILEDCQDIISELEDADLIRDKLVSLTQLSDRISSDHILGFIKGENSAEDFLLPLFEGGISKETFSFLVSEFKKRVNKQKIHGGSAVQATAYGIRGYEESENLQYVVHDGNVLYAECEIAWDLSYKDNYGRDISLKFEDWCNPDGTLKLSKEETTSTDYLSYKGKDGKCYIPLIEKKYPGILNVIAYRIPTEDKYSLLNMRVVRFTRKFDGGGVLKVPNPGTTVAGFDFDIDKLYLLRREYRYGGNLDTKKAWDAFYSYLSHAEPSIYNELEARWREHKGAVGKFLDDLGFYVKGIKKYELGEDLEIAEKFAEWLKGKELDYGMSIDQYDSQSEIWNQPRWVRNNLIIQLIQKRLEDPSTMIDRFTPGGFKHAIEAMERINTLRGIELESLDFSIPQTLVAFNQQNQIAGKLIGIFANHNANHNMCSFFRTFRISDPKEYIRFGDHTGEGLGDFLNSESLIKELLAASVDAVKEPVLNYLNFNVLTANSAAMLTRLGFSFYEIGLLFNQPIVRRLTKYCEENGYKSLSSGIKAFMQENQETLKGNAESVLNTAVLENEIRNASETYALATLKLMEKIAIKAQELSEIVQGTKYTAANAIGSTPGELHLLLLKSKKRFTGKSSITIQTSRLNTDIDDSQVLRQDLELPTDKDKVLEYLLNIMINPIGYEQVMFDAIKLYIDKLGKYFPYFKGGYTRVIESLDSIIKYYNDDTVNKLIEHVIPYMLKQNEYSLFNPNNILDLKDPVSVGTYFRERFPEKLERFIDNNPEFCAKNALLSALVRQVIPYTKEKTQTTALGIKKIKETAYKVYYTLDKAGTLGEITQDAIRESWEQLYASEDKALKQLAIDLYFYSYHMSGFGFGNVGFNHLAPTSLKTELSVDDNTSYIEFLYEHLRNSASSLSVDNFIRDYIATHPKDSSFVHNVSMKQKESLIGLQEGEDTLTVSSTARGLSSYDASTHIVTFKPALLVDGQLYIASPSTLDASNEKSLYFNQVRKEGKEAVTIQYKKVYTNSPVGEVITSPKDEIINPEEAYNREGSSNTEATIQNILKETSSKTMGIVVRSSTETMSKELRIEEAVEQFADEGELLDLDGKPLCK